MASMNCSWKRIRFEDYFIDTWKEGTELHWYFYLEREVANEFPEDYIIQPEDALVCYGLYANFMKFWKSIR